MTSNHSKPSRKVSSGIITFTPSSWKTISDNDVNRLTRLQRNHDRVKHKELLSMNKHPTSTINPHIGLLTGYNMLSNQPFLQLYDMDSKEIITSFNNHDALNDYVKCHHIKVSHIERVFDENSFTIKED